MATASRVWSKSQPFRYSFYRRQKNRLPPPPEILWSISLQWMTENFFLLFFFPSSAPPGSIVSKCMYFHMQVNKEWPSIGPKKWGPYYRYYRRQFIKWTSGAHCFSMIFRIIIIADIQSYVRTATTSLIRLNGHQLNRQPKKKYMLVYIGAS